MNFDGKLNQPTSLNTNPFAAESLYNTPQTHQQQDNDPFGNL